MQFVEAETDGIMGVNVNAPGKTRLTADQSLQLGVKRVRQRVGESREQHPRFGVGPG
jgi:hypothetical protein